MGTNDQVKMIVLGDEDDDALIDRLKTILKRGGAICVKSSVGLGGSQVLSEAEFEVRGTRLVVVGETYIGLSIKGNEAVVDWITAELGQNKKGVRDN